MDILLVCAGGFSTGVLMNKVKKWSQDNEIEVTIDAVSLGKYIDIWEEYDVVLVAPQISYRADEIKENVEVPVKEIPPHIYGVGDPAKIYNIAKEAIRKEKV